MPNLREHVSAHTPRCLAAVRTAPAPLIENRGAEAVAFRLSSAADGDAGEIHGYDLRDYNPSYKGPCEFVSPLTIKWNDAPAVVIFDSDIHGYSGEMNDSAKLHGSGEPKPFACPQCGGKKFSVCVQIDYADACSDLWEDEPGIAIQDYFSNIMVSGECIACRQVSRVLDMDV